MPRLKGAQMASNYQADGTWCPGCGLHAHVHDGRHRDDCTKGRHLRASDVEPREEDRCKSK